MAEFHATALRVAPLRRDGRLAGPPLEVQGVAIDWHPLEGAELIAGYLHPPGRLEMSVPLRALDRRLIARAFGVPLSLILGRAEWDRLRHLERYERRHAGRVAPRRRNRHGRTGVRRG